MTDVCGNCEVTIKPVVRVIPRGDFDTRNLVTRILTVNDRKFGQYEAGTLLVLITADVNIERVILTHAFHVDQDGWNRTVWIGAGTFQVPMYGLSNFDELGIDPSELIDSRYPQENTQ